MRRIWIASAFLALASAAHAQTFDLVCHGSRSNIRNQELRQTKAGTWTFRIDLTTNRWCRDECPAVLPIPQVDENTITLLGGEPHQNLDMTIKGDLTINRRDGTYTEHTVSDSGYFGHLETVSNGTCERRPFSGFPAPKF